MTHWTTRPVLIGLLCGAACLIAADQPTSRLDAWRILGPGGGGTTMHPTISPHDPNVVVEACDMTGAYITRDGGEAWRMFNLGTVASAFAFDPSDASVIYAAASALFRSEDSGRTWRMVFPDPARGTVKNGWGDHAETIYTTADPSYPSGEDVTIHAIAVDDIDPARLYIAVQARKPGPPGSSMPETTALLTSPDRGRSWTRLTDFPPEQIFSIWVDGTAERIVRALGESGVYEGRAGAWRHMDSPPAVKFQSGSVGHDKVAQATIIYATSALQRDSAGPIGGIYVSTDSGRSWRASNDGLAAFLGAAPGGETWGPAEGSRPHLGPIGASAGHGLSAYVGLRGLRSKDGDGRPFNGVARTGDGGRTWTIVHRESDRPAANFLPSWIETRSVDDGYSVWLDAPYDLAVAPGDPAICYVTDLFRTYRTLDGGGTWAQVNSAPAGGGWVSRGLDVTNHYGILWDPFDSKRVFIPSTDIGLFRSENGGASWIGSSTGVPRSWRNTAYWVAFDPEVKDLMWGAFSGTHYLPRPKMWRRTDPAAFRGGVAVSTDGGRHWTPSNAGMAESAITHILLDPRSPRGNRTLYAAAFGRGVYKSVNNGRTWALKNNGLAPDPRQQPFAWRLAQDPAGTVYLVVARRSERGRIGDADDGAIYKSTDGAERWTSMPLPKGTSGPNAITVDPRDPKRLYLSAWAVATPGGDTGGGIFLSHDAGQKWKLVLSEAQHVYDVTVDPRDPDVMYACGFDQGVHRSTDRGETWRRIRGFNFKWGHRVAPDPADAARIYVTTFGGGIWHGPAAGDPTSTEDVVGVAAGVAARQAVPTAVAPAAGNRLERLVEANIAGVHAYQVLLARRQSKGDLECYSAPGISDGQLEAVVNHQTALLKSDAAAVKAWAAGKTSPFDPAKDLEPLLGSGLTLADTLPVNVFAADLAARHPAPRVQARAVANLYQTVLEVDRDGDLLQDLYRFYIALGLPVYIGQFGLPGSDGDMLDTGRRLEGKACASPFGLGAAEWQIAGRKIWNWGEKNLHVRDEQVLAKEMLAEPAVASLLPKIRAVAPQRIAVIGHSFTMGLHWSSPSAFVPITAAILERENRAVTFRLFQAGGLTSSRAMKRFYQDALGWKPDQVLLVVMNRTDEDFDALRTMGKGFKAAGAKVLMFDNLLDPEVAAPSRLAREAEVARDSGIIVVQVERVLEASPDRGRFLCLDGIHMTEPYHRLMAREWLAFLAGARGAALPPAAPR
ncbi:MAG: hypothetical protein IMZ67_03630 [Acidobacteria bacterium]|nr:hypothetical protein [Acidobacteriota bacterium]